MERPTQRPRRPLPQPRPRGVKSATDDPKDLGSVIAQMALAPSVDAGKLDRLVALRDRMHENVARSAFEDAFAELQLDLPVLSEHGEIRDPAGRLLRTYARWEDINEIIKPLLSRRGFTLRFRTEHQDGKVVVTGILSHRAGFFQETVMRLPLDLSGDKTAVQAVGSSTSYGKRYATAALLNLTTRGEDDDGKAAAGVGPTVDAEQVAELRERLNAAGRSEERLATYLGVSTLADLPLSRLPRALDAASARRVSE